MTGVSRNSRDDIPPDDKPVLLSDKFVTPADAVEWLDPSQFPTKDELAEPGAEVLDDDEGYDGDDSHPTS